MCVCVSVCVSFVFFIQYFYVISYSFILFASIAFFVYYLLHPRRHTKVTKSHIVFTWVSVSLHLLTLGKRKPREGSGLDGTEKERERAITSIFVLC